ncbi:MAG: SseB family protein [Rhodobacter sp.]|nr:SseB family protein [Rhodobacter sp.]MCA3514215.1 SseB family protein [Rhodobacter sp.]MCA3520467.1 SseB family protein [Rhodobacter sp.]MCA3522820.1 SseB family protein [Rhodobacter sp.]MCA3525433.1 SseB family protein [Rhodobacter sp.]
MTPLDIAHAGMQAAPEDDAARLRFYGRLAEDELFLLLETEVAGQAVTPRVFALEDGPVVLVFDREDRLSAFTGAPAPYAALPGRVIAAQLAGQGIGIGINLGIAPSSFLIPPGAVDWLAATLGHAPAEVVAKPLSFHAPGGLPDRLIKALDEKLARAGGLAMAALLAGVSYDGGRRSHMLVFVGAAPGAEAALARAAAEALTFSGVDAAEMDVTFLAPEAPALVPLARVALRLDLPRPAAPVPVTPAAPGMDPDRPPRLK